MRFRSKRIRSGLGGRVSSVSPSRRAGRRVSRLESLEDRTLLSLVGGVAEERGLFDSNSMLMRRFGTELLMPAAMGPDGGVRGGPGFVDSIPPPAALADKVNGNLWTVAERARRVVEGSGSIAARREAMNQIELVRAQLAYARDDGSVHAYIHLNSWSDGARRSLWNLGVVEEAVDDQARIIQTWLTSAQIEAVAHMPFVRQVGLPHYGFSNTGSVKTSGDSQLRANLVRERFGALGINGSGVRVGVISTGMPNAWRVLSTGDLPPTIIIDPNNPGAPDWVADITRDEGTAMLEIVHDIAPGAQLYFSGPYFVVNANVSGVTSVQMVQSINWMIAQGVDVIVDDLGFLTEPYFQDGPVAQAARNAVNQGIFYVTSAGNLAQGHYQKRFEPMTVLPADYRHDFNGSYDAFMNITVPAGKSINVYLQWSDPWGASSNDYAMALYALPISSPSYLLAYGDTIQNGYQDPLEILQWTNTTGSSYTVYLEIYFYGGLLGAWRELEVYVRSNGATTIQYNNPLDSIVGHAAASGVFTVGAIDAFDAGLDDPTPISSRGPSKIALDFYEPQSFESRSSLNAMAVDNVLTRIGQLGYFAVPTGGYFTGTSAAAPHVAGIAALLLSADPMMAPLDARAALTSSAVDIGAAGYDAHTGWGRVDALNAIYSIFTPGPADLVAASDTGTSNSDDITSDNTPTFVGTAPPGSFVIIYANGTQVGSQQLGASATSYSITTQALADGLYTVTVRVAPDSSSTAKGLSRVSAPLLVRVDTTAPVADVIDVTPKLRGTGVNTMTVVFDQEVIGVNRPDFRLTRNGGANLITSAQTVTTSDNVTYTINNLSALTSVPGVYELRLVAAGSGIKDLAGNSLVADAWDTFEVVEAFIVSNTNDSGAGSLREAIWNANWSPGPDVIRFAIGSGVKTIQPLSALPVITEAVTIDGWTQPGYASTPIIELRGSSANAAYGIKVTGGNSLIRGLVINGYEHAIELDSQGGNRIEGCYLGTDVAGQAAQSTTTRGINVAGPSNNNTIGGTAAGAGNLISGNTSDGIRLNGSSGNRIIGNRIGTNAAGTHAIANSTGILIFAGSNNTIGGTTLAERNLISGNSLYSVEVTWVPSSNNLIVGNIIGLDVTGTYAISNTVWGIRIDRSTNNTIGGTAPGARNIIAGHHAWNVIISGVDSTGNRVLGNYIGTNANGTSAIFGTTVGVQISNGATNNTIGGDVALASNVISGNQTGVRIWSSMNVVQGNLIGTTASGVSALGNTGNGITIASGASGNLIGGTTTFAGNVISANGGDGISIDGAQTASNVVRGNLIGTDIGGVLDLGNAQRGVGIWNDAKNNTIGGTTAGARNLIGGNGWDGVGIIGQNSTGNVVSGNWIGVDVTGSLEIPNDTYGVVIFGNASNNTIGGTEAGAGNVISGNRWTGVGLYGAGTTANAVLGNKIGSNPAGNSGVPNQHYGVALFGGASGNLIGTPGAGANLIAFNGRDGVTLFDFGTVGNPIRGNAIHSNTWLGIDLGGNGVTVNDSTDGDTGPNGYQNYPWIWQAVPGATSRVVGHLDSAANQTYTLDFYASATADPFSFGEGARWLGSIEVTTNASGFATYDIVLNAATVPGEFITATATSASGDTSEFSASIMAEVDSVLTISDVAILEGNSGTKNAVFTVTLSSPQTSTVKVNYATSNGTAIAGSDYTAKSGTLSFTPGTTSRNITVSIIGDTVIEPDETFFVTLSAPVNAVISGGVATGTILNDDILQPSISINDVSLLEGNSGTKSAVFTVTLSSPFNQTLKVNYATANGTAAADLDYTAKSGQISFLAGETSKTISITVKGDTLVEPDETFFVNLSSPTFGTLAKAQSVGTIVNDDIVQPNISIDDVQILEGASGTRGAVFTISLSSAFNQTLKVNYATANGTATAGSDYTARSGTVSFLAGETSKTVSITVQGDVIVEPDETFFVNLTNPTFGTIVKAQGVGSILNDDIPQPTVSINDASIVEGNSGTRNLVFTLTLSAAYNLTVKVNYATADGTAMAGSDFTAKSGTISFTPGVTSRTVSISINGDLLVEPDEAFFVHLSTPVYTTIVKGTGVGTILNDDVNPLRLASRDLGGAMRGVLLASADPLITMLDAALERWRQAGVDAGRLEDLRQIDVRIAPLPGDYLALAGGGVIWVDADAAGRGWYVDTTPWNDDEFLGTVMARRRMGVDLLSVLAHELGHVLGLEDMASPRYRGVMSDRIRTGTRVLPLDADAERVGTTTELFGDRAASRWMGQYLSASWNEGLTSASDGASAWIAPPRVRGRATPLRRDLFARGR